MSVFFASRVVKRRNPPSPRNVTFLFTIALVCSLALIPLFFLLWNSFKNVSPGQAADLSLGNFTLSNFVHAYANPQTFIYLGNTFYFAVLAMIVALFFGGSIAFLAERTNTPFRTVIYGLMFVPLIMPGMLKAISWVMLISPNIGLLNSLGRALGFSGPIFNAYSIPAMSWVEGLSMTPMVFLVLGAAFRAMDPSLEEAAYTSGAGRLTTMRRITIRLMAPALAGVALLMLVIGMEALDVPLIMGMQAGIMTYSTQIFYTLKVHASPVYGEAYVYSLLLVALGVVALVFYRTILSRSEKYVTVTGKGYRPRVLDLGKWRALAGAFILFFLFVAIVLPFIVLLWASLFRFLSLPSADSVSKISLENYRAIPALRDLPLVLRNTAILAGAVSVGGMLFGLLISWIVLRLKPRGSWLLDMVAFLPYTIPSVALAFSFMVFFLRFPLPVYGTIWILILAHLTRYLPIATRFTHSGLAQVHKELEEAAATAGAGFFVTMRRILIPLLIPSLISGGLFMLMITIKVFDIAAILYTPATMVLSVYIYYLWYTGELTLVGALGVAMVLVLSVVVLVSRTVTQRTAMARDVVAY